MNLDEFRIEMEASRQAAVEEARSLRYSQLALNRLHDLYLRFGAEEREMADQVLEEWALSEDEDLRFDALALISRCEIVHAVPTLQKLVLRLVSNSAPSAPYELEKVNRILGSLTGV